MPSNKCEHDRDRSKCKECGGSQICEHDRIRSRCKECLGSSICPHKRQKSTCMECGGSQICEHNRIRSKCKECPGRSAAVKPPLAGAVSRRMQAGEPLAGKKRKRQAAPGSPDAMGKRRSSGKEPADYEEASASSGDDGERCGRSGAGVEEGGREEEEEAFERELDALIREEAERM